MNTITTDKTAEITDPNHQPYAGRGIGFAKRCAVGLAVWDTYR
jgi:hypothetical protein